MLNCLKCRLSYNKSLPLIFLLFLSGLFIPSPHVTLHSFSQSAHFYKAQETTIKMQYTAIILATLAGSASAALGQRQVICNPAAIAQGFCNSTAAILPTGGSNPPFLCNGTTNAQGACNATVIVIPTVTTQVVTILTTYCPAPTTLTINSKTYTVTAATTLTITDCPCTIVGPITSTGPAGPDTPVPTSTYVLCNAAAIARGACTPTVTSGPAATPAVFTGAADSAKPALALVVLGVVAFL